ncbi:hypothetical protein T06_5929 [Trichinella sp. T6]|nr:hypothetical protein T06_5929 [Trichinella sp. T6]
MWLTARLFRPGKAAQYKRLRKHPGCLIAFRRFRPPDAIARNTPSRRPPEPFSLAISLLLLTVYSE